MNLIYAVTCLAFISYLYHLYSVSKANRAHATYFFEIMEKALPKLVPSLYAEEKAPEAEQGLPPGLTPEMMAAGELKLQEQRMRDTLESLTAQILAAYQYQITYTDAHAKAEQIVVEMYAVMDRPLAARISSLIAPTGTGEYLAGVVPPKQAPQAAANLN